MAMTSTILKIGLGSKVIGIISFIAIILLALSFVLPYFRWETLLVAVLVILIYSFQASKINYIRLNQGQFIIESIFRPIIRKETSLFCEVVELIPFSHLMRIKFKDGSSYVFWGKSDIELNRVIKKAIEQV